MIVADKPSQGTAKLGECSLIALVRKRPYNPYIPILVKAVQCTVDNAVHCGYQGMILTRGAGRHGGGGRAVVDRYRGV